MFYCVLVLIVCACVCFVSTQRVKRLYTLQHTSQTYEVVGKLIKKYSALSIAKRSVWAMLEYLDNVHDDSDPDTDLSQVLILLVLL